MSSNRKLYVRFADDQGMVYRKHVKGVAENNRLLDETAKKYDIKINV